MIKLTSLPDRALDLADTVGDNLKYMMVPSAGTWVSTGMKLGAIKTGARVAGLFLRRHPVLTVASVAGAGLLWYAAKRRSEQAEQGNGESGRSQRGGNRANAIEGSSRRVEARSADNAGGANGGGRRRAGGANTGARKRAASRGGQASRGGDNAPRSTH